MTAEGAHDDVVSISAVPALAIAVSYDVIYVERCRLDICNQFHRILLPF